MTAFKRDYWSGPHWRSWALAAGVGIVVVTALLAWLVSVLVDQSFAALLAIGLLAGLLVLSMMGSGMLSSTSRRMSRGGLAREVATLDVDNLMPERNDAERVRNTAARDRSTIRVAIMLLPSLLALIYLLAR